MSHAFLLAVLALLAFGSAVVGGFLIYAAIRYAPIIGRIFEEKPLFLPLRLAPAPDGEDVRFTTADGIELAGTYHRAQASPRAGVLVFCHEYLSNRHSFQPYLNGLRNRGFDVFTFDFRSHGDSASEPNYRPLQWVTDHEVRDLAAALEYVRGRPDADPAGVGLVGVSRGGGIALTVAATDPTVWGVATDGAFPTRGTMLAYILRWAEIYVSNKYLWRSMPMWVFRFVASAGRLRSEKRLNCRYPDIEKAVGRIAPRPWLMIHGEKDAYILPAIARDLFARASEPKELWIVPKAKHNRCREVAPELYEERLTAFFARCAPRRLADLPTPAAAPPRQDPPDVADGKGNGNGNGNGTPVVKVGGGVVPRPKAELTGSAVGGSLATPVPG